MANLPYEPERIYPGFGVCNDRGGSCFQRCKKYGTVVSITQVIIEPGKSSFYLRNSQMQIIDITAITYSWASAGPLTRIDWEPETLVTFNPAAPPPVHVVSSQFAQRAPLGYGTRALMFMFSGSTPTAAHTLTVELEGLCTIRHVQ
jgi:hypothetical protein